jgi:hypothetical protein
MMLVLVVPATEVAVAAASSKEYACVYAICYESSEYCFVQAVG